MATFQEAIVWLREGKKVRRKDVDNEKFRIILSEGELFYYQISEDGIYNYSFDINEFEATDWEIFEEKESLSDKIENYADGCYPFPVLIVEHAKQKIQNAQRRLKEESDSCIERGQFNESYFQSLVDKIFKEEFGSKLMEEVS